MAKLRFRGKIILPVGLLIVALLLTTLTVAILQFNTFNNQLIDERLFAAASSIRHLVDDTRRVTIDVGLGVSMDSRIVNVMRTGDRHEIIRVVTEIVTESPEVTWITAFDSDAIVYFRYHDPEAYGDLVRTPILIEALDGIISVAYNQTGPIPIPIRSAVPVIHEGEIIGGLTVARALGTQAFVEGLKERHNAEFVVFVDGISVASTFMGADGNPILGTQMLPVAYDRVVHRQQEVFEIVDLRGELFSAFFMPIIAPDGEVLGQIFMALPLGEIFAQRNFVILTVAGIGILGVAAALLILFVLSGRIIRPIHRLKEMVKEVVNGNFNVNINKDKLPKDEIGSLTGDVLDFVEVVRNVTADVFNFAEQVGPVGDYEFRMDAGKYKGSFKELVEGINNVTEGADDESWLSLGVMENVGKGIFEFEVKQMPGKRAITNDAIDVLLNNLKNITADMSLMIDAVANKGDLSFKIDESKYEGGWCTIMEGLNSIADAVNIPIQVIEKSLLEMKSGNYDLDNINNKIASAGVSLDTVYNSKGVFKSIITVLDDSIVEIASYITEISNDLTAIAEGDLTTEITREYVGSFRAIKESLNNISVTLNKTMSDISAASDQVLTGAKQISESAMELANGATEQASSVQELNASIDMINQQTQQNADSANEANTLSNRSTENAKEGNEDMKQMLDAMHGITEASNNISKIIKTIQEIAFQTNLLALNASVEAARAGEHGKGFAVVADEVRTLAGRSQTAAEETTSLIENSIKRVKDGSNIAESTAKALDVIVNNADEMLEVINRISASSKEQADAIGQVSAGLEQISSVVQSNSSVSEEAAAASEELTSQAEMLRQLVGYFKL